MQQTFDKLPVINSLLEDLDQEAVELEFRFGEFRGFTFISSVGSKSFYRILDYFLTHQDIYQYIPDEISVKTEKALGIATPHNPDLITENIYIDQNDKRLRERFIAMSTFTPRYYSYKTNVKNIDSPDFYYRFSMSSEQDIGAKLTPTAPYLIPLKSTQQALRKKARWSFAPVNGINNKLAPFRIDLTHVTGWFINKRGEEEKFNEYEVELEIIKKPVTNAVEQLAPGIELILQLMQNTQYITNSKEVSRATLAFNKLFADDIDELEKKRRAKNPKWQFNRYWRLYNPANKPINIKLKNLIDPADLAVTDKADGERKLMFIRTDGAYLLFPPGDVMKFLPLPEAVGIKLNNTILDGELVELVNGQRRFLAFDIIFNRGVDYRNQQFADRIAAMTKLLKLNPIDIDMKEYYMLENNFYSNANKVLDSIKLKPYGNDGLIINNVKSRYYEEVYKWKPPQLMTIDFYIKKLDGDKFKLYAKHDEKYDLVPFVGKGKYPVDNTVEIKPAMLGNFPLVTGQIVEMSWKNNTFVPFRIRHDRDQPNNLSTAISVWMDIMRPIEESTIRGRDLVMMRYLHNIIKRDTLQVCDNKYLLDIGSGKGGDIHKWKGLGVRVLAVEPSLEHIGEFIKRLEDDDFKNIQENQWEFDDTKVTILNAFGQDSVLIVKTWNTIYNGKKAGCVAMFNALTFFFDKEESLESLINGIDKLIDENGYFIGMVMDGNRVRKLLGDSENVKDYSWSISKIGQFTDNSYGNKIKIHLDETIVTDQIEYLVDFKELSKKLVEKNIILEETTVIDKLNLSPSQQRLNDLYRIFKFKKVSLISKPKPPVKTIEVEEPVELPQLPTQESLEYIPVTQPLPKIVSGKIIEENIIDSTGTVYSPVKFESIKNLKVEEREPLQVGDHQFVRIGNINGGECVVSALSRAVFKKYQMDRNTVEKPKLTPLDIKRMEDQKDKLLTFILMKIEESFTAGSIPSLSKYFATWEDAYSVLKSCSNWAWLGIWEDLAEIFTSNIVIIRYLNPFTDLEVYRTSSEFERTIVLFSHDNLFDTVGRVEDDVIITSFSKDDEIINSLF